MSASSTPRIDGFAAVLGAADVGAALAYYRDVLGFAVDFTWGKPPTYAGLQLGPACLHLAQSTRKERGRVCFFCEGLDELYRDFEAKGAKITQPITVEPYNMREFWVADLDGNELVFGEPTRAEDHGAA
jgi:uncharacterized glyoxalase superfamily protein PhnB